MFIDYIIPFHKDIQRLTKTLNILRQARMVYPIKNIFFCHNGVIKNTDEFDAFKKNLHDNEFLYHTDVAGIGAGYKLGIEKSQSEYIVLSASDLPFSLSDLKQFLILKPYKLMVIGSKAHAKSVISGRSYPRRATTQVFYLIRKLLFGPKTPGDSQGTIIIKRDLATKILDMKCSDSYLFSLEAITYATQAFGIEVVEVPIIYEESGDVSAVRIVGDSLKMAKGVMQLKLKLWQMKVIK